MYIRNYPQVFVKDGKQRNVYYTVEACDLISLGWKQQSKEPSVPPAKTEAAEQPVAPPVIIAAAVAAPVVAEEVKPEVITEEAAKVEQEHQDSDLESFTKVELLQYALDRGVDLPNNALKAQLLKSCKEI
jgi:hypothetical protein